MYLNNDALLRVRLATRRARELDALIRAQIARSRALTDHAVSVRRSGSLDALRPAIEEALQASEHMAGEAREHLRRSRGLLSRGAE